MERKLFQAFDRQRFQQNARLAGIISDVENRYARVLTDDNLEMVSAAGTTDVIRDETMLIIPILPQDEPANEPQGSPSARQKR